MKKVLAGAGTALLFQGDNLIAVAKTLSESSFSFSVTAEEVRGGRGNSLWARYYHDSAMTGTIQDIMFDLDYISMAIGTPVNQGGLSVKEESATVATAKQIPITATPRALNGSLIAWYQKPGADDKDWKVANIKGTTGSYYLDVADATVGDKYCVKYFYTNENARSIIVPAQFVPDEVHLVVFTDLISGDPSSEGTSVIGRLVTDIPRFSFDGNQDLSMSATGAATISLSGSALAVSGGDTSCETDSYYATLTEEIYGDTWQDNVVALAIANNDIELATAGTATLEVYAVYGGNTASQMKPNSNFTFAVVGGSSSVIAVSQEGVVTANGKGTAYVEVTLTGKDNVAPAYAQVTVA